MPKQTESVKPVDVGHLPSFLAEKAPVKVSGTEDMQGTLTTPRIQLAQAMTPQARKSDPAHIDGLEEGMFFHSVSAQVVGSEFEAAILKIWNSRTLFDADNNVDCFSSDTVHGSVHSELCGDCDFQKWVDGEPPACVMFQNHLVVTPHGEPAVLSIKLANKHATAEAKNIRTQAKLAEGGGHGLYAYVFRFASKPVKNAQGQSYFVPSAKLVGYVPDEDTYDRFKAMAEDDAYRNINRMPPRRKEE